jgi:catechol 2,3-dioxygenase-like lactoylglutathione lyase family enzyme
LNKEKTMTVTVDRRQFLLSLPALAMAPAAMAQSSTAQIRMRGLNHVTLTVSDLKRSVDFYQGLFGMPIQARQGSTLVVLRLGSGPQSVMLSTGGANATPGINHLCVGVEEFDVDRILKILADHGIARADGGGPMKSHVRMRGPENGGAKEGTAELTFRDPDGIVVQLQDPSYCGGAGALGNVCPPLEAAPKKGPIALRDLSHCTISVADSQRSNAFYRQLFGMPFRSYQGPTAPTLAVGPKVEFLMFAGGGAARSGAPAAPARPASINHFCMNLEGFNPDQILKTLDSYGIKPRENPTGPVGPMRSYVSMRMENRGGAKEGTPELYFTDPDGILVQLQDVSYCGGAGFLGNVCPPV